MCGIAGILGVPKERARIAATRMLAAMQHRGPDGSGREELSDSSGDNCVILLHTRLAILDLSPSGNQPMRDVPTNMTLPANWVAFNGEIYNYLSLHPELAAAGWPCRTRCDTEVILNAYRVWGEAAVDRLRGMFAWCLVDTNEEKVWLCRDPLGIKPLYIYRPRGGGLLFASEIRTILAAGEPLVEPVVNSTALESFLAQGAVCGSESIIAGIESLEPGQSLITDWTGRPLKSSIYWDLPSLEDSKMGHIDRSAVVAELAEVLRESVKSHLISDVPIGIFLSGGIDSSSLVTIAQEVSQTPVQTISLGFDQKEFDETALAQVVADTLGTQHKTIQLSGQTILDSLTDVLAAIDQPTVDGFNSFFVSKETRKAGLTVALSGLGGDELFGGYASFRDVKKALFLRQQLKSFNSLSNLYAKTSAMLPGRTGSKFAELWKRPPLALDMYLLRRELFMPEERRTLYPLPGGSDPFSGVPLSLIEQLRQFTDADTLNQVSFFELSFYMRYMLLRDADVFSMSSGLEVRVPLLDRNIVELVFPLPAPIKYDNSRTKALLTDAVGKNLPLIVLNQPKRGFKFPWEHWLRGALFNRVEAAIKNQDIWKQLGFNHLAVNAFWQRFLKKDRSVSPLQILVFLILEDYAKRHSLIFKA